MAEDTKNVKFHEEVQKMEYEPLDATELKLIHWSWALGVFLLMALYFLSDFIAPCADGLAVGAGKGGRNFLRGFRRVHGDAYAFAPRRRRPCKSMPLGTPSRRLLLREGQRTRPPPGSLSFVCGMKGTSHEPLSSPLH